MLARRFVRIVIAAFALVANRRRTNPRVTNVGRIAANANKDVFHGNIQIISYFSSRFFFVIMPLYGRLPMWTNRKPCCLFSLVFWMQCTAFCHSTHPMHGYTLFPMKSGSNSHVLPTVDKIFTLILCCHSDKSDGNSIIQLLLLVVFFDIFFGLAPP